MQVNFSEIISVIAYILEDLGDFVSLENQGIGRKINRISQIFHYRAKNFLGDKTFSTVNKEKTTFNWAEFDINYKTCLSKENILKNFNTRFLNLGKILNKNIKYISNPNFYSFCKTYIKMHKFLYDLLGNDIEIPKINEDIGFEVDLEEKFYIVPESEIESVLKYDFICIHCGEIYKSRVSTCFCGCKKNYIVSFSDFV